MPGIFKPRRALDRAMVTTAWGGAKDADIVLVLIDAERGIKGDADMILDSLKDVRQPKILVLNKIDQVRPESLLKLTTDVNSRADFARTFMVSALTGSGCSDLLDYLAEALPAGPWYYPEDQVSDATDRMLAARSPRICGCIGTPIPRISRPGVARKEDGSVRIEQVIYVERDSQRDRAWPQGRDDTRHRPAARMEIARPRPEGAPVSFREGA
jgi:GTP-binding protein Era